MIVEFEHLSFVYRSPFAEDHTALSDISLVIGENELVALVGESGSGKTTLIQHLNGLLLPDNGRMLVDSKDISDPAFDMADLRKRIGIVFQFPENQIFEERVFSDVAFGPKNLGFDAETVSQSVRDALELMDLSFEAYSDRSPFTLSGGEKRRVAIAGVLAMSPEFLVMDEPTVGLDSRSSNLVENMMLERHRSGATVVFISHDIDMVARLAERVIVMHHGRIGFDGRKTELFSNRHILEKTGLESPSVPRFLERLKREGWDVRTDIYTVEEAKREMDRSLLRM